MTIQYFKSRKAVVPTSSELQHDTLHVLQNTKLYHLNVMVVLEQVACNIRDVHMQFLLGNLKGRYSFEVLQVEWKKLK